MFHKLPDHGANLFLVSRGNIESQGWRGHTLSMAQDIFDWNCFIRKFSSVKA
jgi:hypothetical protein